MLFAFGGLLAGCATLRGSFVAVECFVAESKKEKRSKDLYKSDGSQGSYSVDARQGSKCWDHLQSLAGEKLWVGKLSKFPLIHGNGNLLLGLGERVGRSAKCNSPQPGKKPPPSSACHNETAALAITDVSPFMAVICFLVQKKKKMPFYSKQNQRCLLQPAVKGVSF